jgi:hypothetical protein
MAGEALRSKDVERVKKLALVRAKLLRARPHVDYRAVDAVDLLIDLVEDLVNELKESRP